MRIKYKNVCSIRDADVTFNKGELVCIKGESNQGKSAMFYALVDGLVNNKTFKNWINNDALKEDPKAFARIELYDDEDNKYQVEAGTNHMYYRHGGVKYEKVGRKSIFEIIQKQINGLLYDPDEPNQILNVVGEDSGMFPIDRPDSQIFKTYERLLSLSCTQDITRAIKLDLDDIDYKCSDMLKSIQSSNDALIKIDKTLEQIDVDRLQKVKIELQAFIDTYYRLNSIYNSIKSTSDYINSVKRIKDTQLDIFDISKASSLLNSLIKAKNIDTYCNIANKLVEDCTYLDLDKVIKINQSYSLALSINKDLDSLNIDIERDIKLLDDINSKLSSIKICPLCGKPMEEK